MELLKGQSDGRVKEEGIRNRVGYERKVDKGVMIGDKDRARRGRGR